MSSSSSPRHPSKEGQRDNIKQNKNERKNRSPTAINGQEKNSKMASANANNGGHRRISDNMRQLSAAAISVNSLQNNQRRQQSGHSKNHPTKNPSLKTTLPFPSKKSSRKSQQMKDKPKMASESIVASSVAQSDGNLFRDKNKERVRVSKEEPKTEASSGNFGVTKSSRDKKIEPSSIAIDHQKQINKSSQSTATQKPALSADSKPTNPTTHENKIITAKGGDNRAVFSNSSKQVAGVSNNSSLNKKSGIPPEPSVAKQNEEETKQKQANKIEGSQRKQLDKSDDNTATPIQYTAQKDAAGRGNEKVNNEKGTISNEKKALDKIEADKTQKGKQHNPESKKEAHNEKPPKTDEVNKSNLNQEQISKEKSTPHFKAGLSNGSEETKGKVSFQGSNQKAKLAGPSQSNKQNTESAKKPKVSSIKDQIPEERNASQQANDQTGESAVKVQVSSESAQPNNAKRETATAPLPDSTDPKSQINTTISAPEQRRKPGSDDRNTAPATEGAPSATEKPSTNPTDSAFPKTTIPEEKDGKESQSSKAAAVSKMPKVPNDDLAGEKEKSHVDGRASSNISKPTETSGSLPQQQTDDRNEGQKVICLSSSSQLLNSPNGRGKDKGDSTCNEAPTSGQNTENDSNALKTIEKPAPVPASLNHNRSSVQDNKKPEPASTSISTVIDEKGKNKQKKPARTETKRASSAEQSSAQNHEASIFDKSSPNTTGAAVSVKLFSCAAEDTVSHAEKRAMHSTSASPLGKKSSVIPGKIVAEGKVTLSVASDASTESEASDPFSAEEKGKETPATGLSSATKSKSSGSQSNRATNVFQNLTRNKLPLKKKVDPKTMKQQEIKKTEIEPQTGSTPTPHTSRKRKLAQNSNSKQSQSTTFESMQLPEKSKAGCADEQSQPLSSKEVRGNTNTSQQTASASLGNADRKRGEGSEVSLLKAESEKNVPDSCSTQKSVTKEKSRGQEENDGEMSGDVKVKSTKPPVFDTKLHGKSNKEDASRGPKDHEEIPVPVLGGTLFGNPYLPKEKILSAEERVGLVREIPKHKIDRSEKSSPKSRDEKVNDKAKIATKGIAKHIDPSSLEGAAVKNRIGFGFTKEQMVQDHLFKKAAQPPSGGNEISQKTANAKLVVNGNAPDHSRRTTTVSEDKAKMVLSPDEKKIRHATKKTNVITGYAAALQAQKLSEKKEVSNDHMISEPREGKKRKVDAKPGKMLPHSNVRPHEYILPRQQPQITPPPVIHDARHRSMLQTKEKEIYCAVNLVAKSLNAGPWPSPVRSLEPEEIYKRNQHLSVASLLGEDKETEGSGKAVDPIRAHRDHVFVVVASLKQFTEDIIKPKIMEDFHMSLSLATDQNEVYDNGPLRIFLGTLLMLREVMCQNAYEIFGPSAFLTGQEEDFDVGRGAVMPTPKISMENAAYTVKILATAVILAGLSELGPRSDNLTQVFLEMIADYDKGKDVFVENFAPIDEKVVAVLPSGHPLGDEEMLAWRIALNCNRDKHPLLVENRSRKRRRREARMPVTVAEPDAVHISMLENIGSATSQEDFSKHDNVLA